MTPRRERERLYPHLEPLSMVPAQPVYLKADPERLAQILANLLSNAAKYTSEGGQITLRARIEESEVVIRVQDNGIGIAADKLLSIFELFSQVDTSAGRSHGGLGIGLTLVRTLVTGHGGTVAAHSAGRDRGSEFVVRLPIDTPVGRDDSRAQPRAHRQPDVAPPSSLRIWWPTTTGMPPTASLWCCALLVVLCGTYMTDRLRWQQPSAAGRTSC